MKDMTLEEKTIQFIQKVAESYSNETLYAGNSGGKDSAVLDYLLQKSGIEYTSIYANTTIDPIGTIKHIRVNYPHTIIMQPKETFYQLVERKGLPTRLNRYCCEFLKEYVSVGKIMFEGVRSSESKNRQIEITCNVIIENGKKEANTFIQFTTGLMKMFILSLQKNR